MNTQRGQVVRFCAISEGLSDPPEIRESLSGDFVYFEDYQELEAERQAALDNANELQDCVKELKAKLAEYTSQEPVEWQIRYAGDPRRIGLWHTTSHREQAQIMYARPNHTDEYGYEVRPLYDKPTAPAQPNTVQHNKENV